MSHSFSSISDLTEAIRAGKISAVEVVSDTLAQIDKVNPKINSVTQTFPEALERAKTLDRASSQGLLHGVPVLVKDNFCVKDSKTTAASKILGNYVSPYTAFCLEKLEEQGAVLIGKTNLDEFGMGSSNENSIFGACKNPWDLTRVPGGSSGGSAAAVAARLSLVAIGSDTGGSIRQPANFCGVVGIKPSYGLVSRYGMIAFASSLDQPGTFGSCVADAALTLDVMIGKDVRDSTNVRWKESSLMDSEKTTLSSFKVGVIKDFFDQPLDSCTQKKMDEVVNLIKKQAGQIVEISLPHSQYAIPTYYLISASEASSNLSRYDGVRYGLRAMGNSASPSLEDMYAETRSQGFGDEVKRRIMLGTFSLSAGYNDAYYAKACQVRRLIAEDFQKAFSQCDILIGPVTTEPAFSLGEKSKDPVAMYYNDLLTTPASLAGLPAMSLPVGLSDGRLPIGLQVIGPQFKDHQVVAWSKALEQELDFQERPHV